jgi:thiamine monophosphate synthase
MDHRLRNKLRKINIPEEWFFCNPFDNYSEKIICSLTCKTGVIFFSEEPFKKKEFIKNIEPLVQICRKNRIIFFIQSSFFLASKYNANGILIDFKNKVLSNMVNLNLIKEKFLLAVKIHNLKEAKKLAKNIDIIFISNVFKTKSHPRRKGLGTKKLFELCMFLKNKLNFALGGINKKNISLLKNKGLKGFGAISYFRE